MRLKNSLKINLAELEQLKKILMAISIFCPATVTGGELLRQPMIEYLRFFQVRLDCNEQKIFSLVFSHRFCTLVSRKQNQRAANSRYLGDFPAQLQYFVTLAGRGKHYT